MKPFKILFVDDEEINLLNFRMIFQGMYEIITAISGEEGLRCFQETDDIGLVISDQRMPGISGTDMLSKIYEIDPDPIRVLLTAHSQVEYILDAINLGRIYQYILKPWDTSELIRLIDRAKDLYLLKKENFDLTEELSENNKSLELINQKLWDMNDVLEKDVLRRKRLEASLRESEERFRKFTQASQDIIVLFDIAGKMLYVNPAAYALLGYNDQELINKSLATKLHLDDRRIVRDEIKMLLSSNLKPMVMEVKIQKKNKEYLDMEMGLFCMDMTDGERIIGSVVRDISQRKKDEEQLLLSEKRLSDLSAMLITAQDDERRRISMELHDEFGQSLAALKLQLHAMENKLYSDETPQKDETVEGLRELRQYVNIQIDYVRNLSHELWPAAVDDLGIDAAFKNLISKFLKYSDIDIDINMEPIGSHFSVEEQRHLYRLLQESLNNIIKHADAKAVQIHAGLVDDDVVIAVHDNGCGFDVDAVSKVTGKTRGIGLQAIAERVKLLNGKMQINSRPGMGTSIIFTLSPNGDK